MPKRCVDTFAQETEYFIADIEVTERKIGASFDMLAFKLPRRIRSGDVQLALIEMKYGVNSLTGKSGFIMHLQQFYDFLYDEKKRNALRNAAQYQINQLNELGLLNHTRKKEFHFTVTDDPIEVVFLFANHKPLSGILQEKLEEAQPLINKMNRDGLCKIHFFVASSAGYGLYEKCMMELDEYRDFLKKM